MVPNRADPNRRRERRSHRVECRCAGRSAVEPSAPVAGIIHEKIDDRAEQPHHIPSPAALAANRALSE
jgi:hypothetical protein